MKISISDLSPGCYVDGVRGVYVVDAVVDFATACGFTLADSTCGCDYCKIMPTTFKPSSCEFWAEIEGEATDFMNENYPVDQHSWGRSESGDWGLWADNEL